MQLYKFGMKQLNYPDAFWAYCRTPIWLFVGILSLTLEKKEADEILSQILISCLTR